MRRPAPIVIRAYAESDAEALHRCVRASLPSLAQWLPWATPDYDLERAASWIGYCRRMRETDDEYHFGVFRADTGELLGGVGLNHRIRAYRSAHMGYWVADAARGHGVAVEASRLAAHFGFGTLALQRIAILIQPDNRASLRVAEKLGATREGLARHAIVLGDRPQDAQVYSLLPGDMTVAGTNAAAPRGEA